VNRLTLLLGVSLLVGCARSVPARNQLQLTPAHSNQNSDLRATGFSLISKAFRNPTHRT
jgi:uncharacterized lipoprotein YajG